jgi:hypothetical protein
MAVYIKLLRADVDCLLDNLPPESSVRPKLANSDTVAGLVGLPMGPSNPFECDEPEARELLKAAKKYCPTAVREIKKGIKLAWPEKPNLT